MPFSGDTSKLGQLAAKCGAMVDISHLVAPRAAAVISPLFASEFSKHADAYGRAWRKTKKGNAPMVRTSATASSARAVAQGLNIRLSLGTSYIRYDIARRPVFPQGGAGLPAAWTQAIQGASREVFAQMFGGSR